VAVNVIVDVVEGKAVTIKRGVAVAVFVVEPVKVVVGVAVSVLVDEAVGGSAVGETEAASCPTAKETPQTSGRDRVAE
jgi:hypothetical protein